MATNQNTTPGLVSPVVSGGQVEITARLYRTTDDRLVQEGHPDAAFLYATPGMRIPVSEAQRYGLMPTSTTATPGKARRKPTGS
ncbi:hypothetical protein JOF56_005716 [Kibdelosporangium banguiense]|uniref:Uncharacterized protein n=1 Tax=Kibdelosporangium banguiense TaxID=1365924 RepID=A0ABS4TN68_9PSEU|nr:hypothetical protein [Kibdelosporangium banguiense]MBP2325331.1 hypothetical protein [Kibdelosporangium banguiense]